MNENTGRCAAPSLGFGLGLRTKHYETILEQLPKAIDWFEVLTENYLSPGGKPRYFLDQIRAHYPMVMHGVSLSIGSTDPLDFDYLKQVKDLVTHLQPKWLSDHLCWTRLNNKNSHDLLPLPYTEEAIRHISARVREVQDYLQCPFLLENLSSYVTYQESQMSEWEFFSAIVEEADCLMLLDVNNVYVSACNHGFNAIDYLDGVDPKRVQQFHLAGHNNTGEIIIDTHDAPIADPVWQLYAEAIRRFPQASVMIERDDHIPALEELLKELAEAKRIAQESVGSNKECEYA